jgi:integrase
LNAKEKFLDDLLARRKKATFKGYRRGLELFEEFYQKDFDTILKEAREKQQSEDVTDLSFFDRKIEAFYKWMLERGYALTSARNNTLGIVQFFNFYRIPTNAKVPMPPPTTKTYIPKIEELRRAFQVSPLIGKVCFSLGLDLSWRVTDFVNLKKSDIPDLNQPTPIPISKVTQKENVISATFISAETVELLKAYLPTLPKNNDYLFPSKVNGGHMKDESITKILKIAFKKAKIEVPKNKHLVFHSLRKRFLSTCATLNIDSEYAKLMCGKKTELGDSFETYLEDADFRESFKKVREDALSLTNGKLKATVQDKDVQIEALKKELDETKLLVKAMTELFGKEILEKAKSQIPVARKSGKPLTPIEALEIKAQQIRKREQEQYEKMLAENNGNGE